MHPVAYLGAGAALIVATVTAGLLSRIFGAPPTAGRFAAIDGLRGYLALFVFLHHSAIWYFYLRIGIWRVPPSNLFTILGQGGVGLFFMITGFLFFNKLLDARHKSVDWTRLYISRVLRLLPLYAFAMLAMFTIVGIASHWTLNVPIGDLLRTIGAWLGFTVLGTPDINGVEKTSVIIAGVTWSLPLEWLFYLSLPILGIAIRVQPSTRFLFLSALVLAILIPTRVLRPSVIQAMWFGCGIASAALVRYASFRGFAEGRHASWIVMLTLTALVVGFSSAYGIIPIALLGVAFSLIAGGCDVFGILSTGMSRVLGDMAYSVYLLHGMVLFVLFKLLRIEASTSSPAAHWAMIVAVCPVLIALCFATFRLIERPGMESVPRVMRWLSTGGTKGQMPEGDAERVASS